MALTKDKKHQVVDEITGLLNSSRITVVANYPGIPVKAMQQLRKDAANNGTKVKVVKNRLVIKALEGSEKFKQTDTAFLHGQLLYAFNAEDEAAPAQALAEFAKAQPNLQFVGAITPDGGFIGADDVQMLSSLPSKDQLRAQLVGTVSAPLSGFVNVLTGNVRGILNVLSARAEAIK